MHHPSPSPRRPRTRRPRAFIAGLMSAALAVGTALSLGAVAAPAAAADSTHGLKGEYFLSDGDNRFAELKGDQLDANIDFGDLVPTFVQQTGRGEKTAVRWTGEIEPEFSEDYTFSAIGDNGFRVWIDGRLVIDHWAPDWDVEQTAAPVALVAGERYDIVVENFQDIGGANMHLRWASASQPKQAVPASALWSPEGYPPFALAASVPASGLTVALEFQEELAGVDAALLDHLVVKSDSQTYPIASVALTDATHLLVTLGSAVLRESTVRIAYDGTAGVQLGGEALPAFDLPAVNGSEHYLATEWASEVDPLNPLPEYPRPQLVRDEWQNLNGPWQFAGADEGAPVPFGQQLAETVTVPYAIESVLSGIERHEDHMYYKRQVSVPAGWDIGSGARLQLNFGAVDYESTVYLNGEKVGGNTGGYLPFSVDLTDALVPGAEQELVVAVTDTTDGNQPIGKQRANPSGIFYTPTSGIWQTVWMEPVPEASIDQVVATPDLAAGLVNVRVASAAASATATVTVTRTEDGSVVGTGSGAVGSEIAVAIPDAHLWSPDDPYLYDLDVSLSGGDSAQSYFGMRSIAVETVGGVEKIVLNGEPEFLLATLDQGYWPESQYTQPTDEALKFDIQETKDLKFNTIRKHIKVESARFYYYADTIGLMVWQDTVPGTTGPITDPAAQANLIQTMHDMVAELEGWTSIIGWTIFNEGWSEWSTEQTGVISDAIKAQDPDRLVNARSGLNCCDLPGDSGKGDVIDWHMYQGPGFPAPDGTRAAVDGEHGGLSLVIPGHTWKGAFSPYGGFDTSEELTAAYVANTAKMIEPARTFMSGAVYTQISDVEGEVNGFFTYDRAIEKMDFAQVRAVNQQVVDAGRLAGTTPPDAGLSGDATYPLDEGTGTTSADASGNGRDLALQNGAGWTEGHTGSALQLDGSSQYASTATPVVDTTGDYTVATRVKLDALPQNWATAASQEGANGNSSFFLQYGNGGFAFSFPGEARAQNEQVAELGRWYQLTGVWDASESTGSLYVDGVLVDTVAAGNVSSIGRLLLGAAQWENRVVDFWPGAIDDVRAYGRALSAAEVARVAAGDTADPTLTLSGSTVKQGATLDIAGAGFTAGTELTATVNSEPVDLGTEVVAADGTAAWRFAVPAGFEVGEHSVVVTDAAGAVLASAAFAVLAADGAVIPGTPGTPGSGSGGGAAANGDPLALTGADLWAPALAASVLLALGGLALVLARRRRAARV